MGKDGSIRLKRDSDTRHDTDQLFMRLYLTGYKTKETSGHFYQKLTRPFTLNITTNTTIKRS